MSGVKLPPPPPKKATHIPLPPPKKAGPPKSPVETPKKLPSTRASDIPLPVSQPNATRTPRKAESKIPVSSKKNISAETAPNLLRDLQVGTPSQIKTLLSLNYANGDPIIDPEHLDILMEIIGMIRSEGFEQAVQFLDGAEDPNFILWEQPSMEEGHNALARELELQQTEEKGIKGIGKCRFCPSTELIVKQAQTRSGDEGMTVFTRCVMCQKQWKN